MRHLYRSICLLFWLTLVGCATGLPYAPAETPTPVRPLLAASNQTIEPETAAMVESLAQWGREPVYALAWAPHAPVLAAASYTGVYLYNAQTLATERFIEDPIQVGVRSVAFSPDGHTLATSSKEDRRLWLWEVSTGKLLHELRGHNDEVESVAFSPDSAFVVSGSCDTDIDLWRAADGKRVQELHGNARDVSSVAYSPDGKYIASGSWDNTVRVWRASDGIAVRILRGHEKFVRSIAFSPDGKYLASASYDNTVRLWDTSDWSLERVWVAHDEFVEVVAFSPQSNLLATAGLTDRTIRLWSVPDGALLAQLSGQSGQLTSVAFSPDGSRLASASLDGEIRLWGVPLTEARSLGIGN